jgi:hypothetical protein
LIATNPQTAIEVEKLSAVLNDLGPNDVATYEALSQVVGYAVQEKPFALMKARKAVEEQTGLRFETVIRVGVKKLPAEALPGIGVAVRKRIARATRRQSKRLSGLRYNDIDRRLQGRIDAERSLLAAISTVATTKPDEIE